MTAFAVSLPEALACPGIQTRRFVEKACVRARSNRNAISVRASALHRILVSGMLIVARGPTLSQYAGVSSIA